MSNSDSDHASQPAVAATSSPQPDRSWQKRMLPLMVRFILALTAFFFIVSLVQLTYLHWTIQDAPPINLDPALEQFEQHPPTNFEERMQLTELRMLAGLDSGTTEQRYHQVSAALMARVWTSYMGFVTGMILALVGAIFILGKMQDAAPELRAAGTGGFGITIKTASPGLVLGVLGVILMLTTIAINHRIDVADAPGNIRYYQGVAERQRTTAIPPPPSQAEQAQSTEIPAPPAEN